MDQIHTEDLEFEYPIRDDDGNVIGIKKAVDGMNVDIKKGEFIGILGGNGSGKSTFARHLNGLLFPTSGAVYVNGIDTVNEEKLFEVRKTVGMVFQNPDNQIVSATVMDDIAFGLENIGVGENDMRKRIKDAAERTGLSDKIDEDPNNLSGGQKQRLSIAGIIAMKPECVVFDEPTSMLDPEGRSDVISIIKSLHHDEKITVILITHFPEEVIACDKIIVMKDGKTRLAGSPGQVFYRKKELEECRVSQPFAIEMADELIEKGLNIPKKIYDPESLSAEIVKML
ncbi:MAG: energy-coupling factor transporter ATPase [Lachnospiraceae bacterium]|jgi:energy-coupling factor transporter ATPase|nr:energy-coupling factor transporter ATPase [Lachnospiraceae bacterium]MEE3460291.1 energy-coupling factor transporter ATPase [Lachnospiraceae bacterium]